MIRTCAVTCLLALLGMAAANPPVRPPSTRYGPPSYGSSGGYNGGGGTPRLYLSWENAQHADGEYTWAQSDQECRYLGLQLVSLASPDKEQEINRRLKQVNRLDGPNKVMFYWTSGQRRTEAGPFFWRPQDRTPVCDRDQYGCYENWGRLGKDGRPQPDNREGQENCLAIINEIIPGEGIVWHDIPFELPKHFVCE